MKILGKINDENTALNIKTVRHFMADLWMKDLVLWILKCSWDFTIVIPWKWENKAVKLILSENMVVVRKNQYMYVFWEEFTNLNGDKKTPIRYFKKIIRKL